MQKLKRDLATALKKVFKAHRGDQPAVVEAALPE
jgi:hypothetical protein